MTNTTGLVTPKQSQADRLRDWYPYYAGFSSSFVTTTLDRHFAAAGRILDPWNGSGTTTAAAGARGMAFHGLDVNPAVTLIARARLTPTTVRDSLGPIADEIASAAERTTHDALSDDPLQVWMRAPSVASVRRLQRAINVLLVGEPTLEHEMRRAPGEVAATVPVLAAFFYAALFATVRDLLHVFRGTNPTWLRYPDTLGHRINPGADKVASVFRKRAAYLAARLTVPNDAVAGKGSIATASVLKLAQKNRYDACLTSPPYATRIDYVRSSLAELAVMGLSQGKIEDLRLATTGSPRTRGIRSDRSALRSAVADRIIHEVSNHPSHGSASYYGPWIRRYLTSLEQSLERIDDAVTPNGRIGLVVQDSFYKAVHVDLQSIVAEAMVALGRPLIAREDYAVPRLFSAMNPAARQHLPVRRNHESLLVFS